ncbi:MAG: NAD(+) diphosphatase, partial [Gammaproteobacteria bacterium]
DAAWAEQTLNDPAARFLLLHNNRNLLSADSLTAQALILTRAQCADFLQDCDREPILLGTEPEQADSPPLIALDVSALDAERLESSTGGAFVDLRKVGAHIDPYQGSLLGFARGLVYWHRNSPYCSRCGHGTRLSRGGYSRRCIHEACGWEHFPRNDPAVIMLVEYQPERGEPLCLLGRNHRFKNGMFSTLAGFVDVGESLEEAVRREVLEEAGVHTFNERYVASQPWPFPGSLMLGFEAQARGMDIQVDETEIAEARWFTRGELSEMLEWEDPGEGPRLPRRDSIARHLIDRWLRKR